MDDAIKMYFQLGMSYSEIQTCLANINGIVLSLSTLKRTLKDLKLFRRIHRSDIVEVALFLVEEVQSSGQLHGYKTMHLKCVQKGYVVNQETIRLLLHIIDPEGIRLRRRTRLRRRVYLNEGPNYLWHIDGYDKLKPFGICINGAIDGFSRYILWLEAHTTNINPKLIGGYFMETVKRLHGCPARIRADKGTENTHVKQMQMFLRRNGVDRYANSCYVEGSSNHNQRIERWWGYLRKEMAQYWMNIFKMLSDMGCYTGDFLDKALIQMCFMGLIQTELDEIACLWNSHRIRPTKNRNIPHGRPNMMFNCESLYGVENFIQPVRNEEIDVCVSECNKKGPFPCDETVHDISCLLIEEARRQMPETGEEAVLLYQFLRAKIRSEL